MSQTPAERILEELKNLYEACLKEKQYQTALRTKQLEVQLLGLISKKSNHEKEGSGPFSMTSLETMQPPELEALLERLVPLIQKKNTDAE